MGRFETIITSTTTTMPHFRLQSGSPEAYNGPGEFDEWLRRLLSYFSLNNQRYNISAQHYLECARDHMAQFYAELLVRDPTHGAD